ncbi:MAG: proton-conducting transporter transmembrane domain-containing protein [Armatimonadota bacterium]
MFGFELTSQPGLWLSIALTAWLLVVLVGTLRRNSTGYLLAVPTLAGCLMVLFAVITSHNGIFQLPDFWHLGDAPFRFVLDPLSRWFLGIIAVVGVPVVLFSSGYLHHLRKRVALGYVWAALAVLFISMCAVVLAGNAMLFLVAWECMAFSSFVLVAADHGNRDIRRAALIYLGATRTGTAFLMAGFLWAHQLTGSWEFAQWALTGAPALGPALLILVGLATKAGSWPFHLWLPIAHPAAPAPVSAIMSGVMIKTAIYAMARFFVVGDAFVHPALGPVILILGAVSAFWGVIFALLQHDLKRLLAYHSVENIGIIMMGLGISLLGKQHHLPILQQLGLAAALFHTLNHAVFKSLLFLGAGSIDARTHLRDIEKLGGLIRRMPWTAGAFIVGSAAICALPPLNGFASEWVLYQGFFELAKGGASVAMRLGGLLLMGWLGLIGALAIACFVKAVGVVFLGNPRSQEAENAKEVGQSMVAAQWYLAALCLLIGISVPALMRPLGDVVAMTGQSSLLASAWSLPMLRLAVALLLGLIAMSLWIHQLQKLHPERRFITWECGFGELGPRTQYTASSFAQPISRLFGKLYSYSLEVQRGGENKQLFAETVQAETHHEAHLETRLYVPLVKSIQRISEKLIMRIQAGSIHQYLLTMALVLALLLWIGLNR